MRSIPPGAMAIAVCLLLLPPAADAAMSGGPSWSVAPALEDIRELIERGRFEEAIGELEDYVQVEPGDADGWNWLGFARRKTGRYKEAEVAYATALKLDPEHLGAHEYLGELYLETGQPWLSKALLARLRELCGDCEQAQDLKHAIEQKGRP